METSAEEKINIIKHDLRHHLAIIGEQIKTGDLKQAADILKTLEADLTTSSLAIYCKNKVINAALNYYLGYAKKENIQVDTILDIPESLGVNPAELAIVFANALENVIHASIKIADISKRKIALISRYINNSLFLKISNFTYETVRFDKNELPIANEDNHGTGVKSILAFVKKNKAVLDFSKEDDVFYLRLVIQSI